MKNIISYTVNLLRDFREGFPELISMLNPEDRGRLFTDWQILMQTVILEDFVKTLFLLIDTYPVLRDNLLPITSDGQHQRAIVWDEIKEDELTTKQIPIIENEVVRIFQLITVSANSTSTDSIDDSID